MAEKTAGIDIVWRNYVTGTYVFSFTIVQYIDDKLSAIAVYCCSSLRNQDLDLHPGRQYAVLFTTLITSEFSLIAARSKLRKVLFLATVCDFFVLFLFVPQISREPLNGFAPNSHGRRVCPSEFERQRSKVKVTWAPPSTPAAYEWYALAANNVTVADGAIPSLPWVISAVSVQFTFCKTL